MPPSCTPPWRVPARRDCESSRRTAFLPVTRTFAVAARPPTLAVMIASPSPTGRTTPSATVATSGRLDDQSIARGLLPRISSPDGPLYEQALGAFRCTKRELRREQHQPSVGQDKFLRKDQSDYRADQQLHHPDHLATEWIRTARGSHDGRYRQAGTVDRPVRAALSRG